MMRIFNVFFLATGTLFLFYSCTVKDSGKSNSTSKMISDFENFNYAIDSSWKKMMKSDDLKIDNMARLVEELQLVDGSSESELNALSSEVKNLKSIRYDIATIKDSKLIDLYDSATNKVIFDAKEEFRKNPNAVKYQIINQLISEIQLADDSVLLYRKDYDKQVDVYNSFVKKNRNELKTIKEEQSKIVEYSLFRLIP